MKGLKLLIATGLGTGYAPVASGTFGTLPAIPLMMATAWLPLWAKLLVFALLFAVGVWTADYVEEYMDLKDPGIVVIDEIAAYYLVMAFFPPSISMYVITFLLFRLFDIIKLWPARHFDTKVSGGMGIMLDDVFAGIHAIIAYWIILKIFG